MEDGRFASYHRDIFLVCYGKGVSRASYTADGGWSVTQTLEDEEATCLASSASNPGLVLAGTRSGGVYRSDDKGLTWARAGMEGEVVKSLAVSPHDPDVWYAGTKPAHLFITTDGGRAWRELESFRKIPNRWWWFSPAEPPDRRPYVFGIAVSPEDPEVVLAGVEFGAVVRSEDGGETWSRHRRGALRDCHSLKFHAQDGKWAYEAGGTGGGASVSRDGGATWQKKTNGLKKKYGIVCAADPEKPDVWYVVTAPSPMNAFGNNPEIYLYRANGGAPWKPIGWVSHPMPEAPTALVTVPGRPGHLLAGLYGGAVWHSADYGNTWAMMPFSFPGIWFAFLVMPG